MDGCCMPGSMIIEHAYRFERAGKTTHDARDGDENEEPWRGRRASGTGLCALVQDLASCRRPWNQSMMGLPFLLFLNGCCCSNVHLVYGPFKLDWGSGGRLTRRLSAWGCMPSCSLTWRAPSVARAPASPVLRPAPSWPRGMPETDHGYYRRTAQSILKNRNDTTTTVG